MANTTEAPGSKLCVSGTERTELEQGKSRKQGPGAGVHFGYLPRPRTPFSKNVQLASRKEEDCSGVFI